MPRWTTPLVRPTAPQPLQVSKYVQYLCTSTPGWQACIPVHQAVAACCCLLAAAQAHSYHHPHPTLQPRRKLACYCYCDCCCWLQVHPAVAACCYLLATGVHVCTITVCRCTTLANLYTDRPGRHCLLLFAGYRWFCCCHYAPPSGCRILIFLHAVRQTQRASKSRKTTRTLAHLYTCITGAA